MHFFDIATSKSGPILMCFDILTSRRNGVQFFISHLASWLRTRRFSSGKSCVLVLCWAPAPFFCCIVQLEPLCFQSTRFNSFYLLIPITGPSLRATSAKLEEKNIASQPLCCKLKPLVSEFMGYNTLVCNVADATALPNFLEMLKGSRVCHRS